MAHAMVNDATYIESIWRRIKADTLPPGVETMLWHYAYGKPKDTIDISVTDNTLVNLTDVQLAAKAKELSTQILDTTAEVEEVA